MPYNYPHQLNCWPKRTSGVSVKVESPSSSPSTSLPDTPFRIFSRPVRQGQGVRRREGRKDPPSQVRDQDHLEVPDTGLEREVRIPVAYIIIVPSLVLRL